MKYCIANTADKQTRTYMGKSLRKFLLVVLTQQQQQTK